MEVLAEHASHVRRWIKTSPGFHSEQVHAEEFAAHLAKESSANLDMMAEARGSHAQRSFFRMQRPTMRRTLALPGSVSRLMAMMQSGVMEIRSQQHQLSVLSRALSTNPTGA